MTEERLTTNIIPPKGNIQARVVFIGEAPGEEEDLLGEPFVGTAGQLLTRALAQKGIDPGDVLFHNCFQQRPPGNDVHYFFKDKSCKYLTWEGQEHIDALRDWLTQLQKDGYLNLVVALGATPLSILTAQRGIYKWRGSILECTLVPGLKVYPTLHPSHVHRAMSEPTEGIQGEKKARIQNALPLFLVDLDRIKMQSEFPEIRRPQRTYRTNLPFTELMWRLKALENERMVAVDIETLPGQDGEGPLLWCIGFSARPEEAFVVPIVEKLYPAWPLHEEAQLHQAISSLFLNPNVDKVLQNGSCYDLPILGRYYGYRVARSTQQDTMLCHHASYPYLYRSLHVLTSIYTEEPYYKDEGRAPLGNRGDQGEYGYNAKDCAVTREIFPIVRQHALDLGTWEGYKRTMRIQPSLIGMMIRGVRIDLEKKAELTRQFLHKVRFHEAEVERLLGKKINLSSAPQKSKLLYGELGLAIQFHHKTKRATTDKDALQKLKRLYEGKTHSGISISELLDNMLNRSKFEKLAANYAEMEIEPDGRVRTSYSIVSTWRLNSSGSPFGGGGNLQNIPKRSEEGREIRKLFITDPVTAPPPIPWPAIRENLRRLGGDALAESMVEGRQIMLARDLSQAEARVVAWEAEDVERIELFLAGWDVHWYNATKIFSIPSHIKYSKETADELFVDPITNEPHTLKQLRNIGKTVVHAGNYGMGPRMLQTILAREGFIFDFLTCRNLLIRHKGRNPLLLEWQKGIREKVQAERILISSYGRKREFMGRMDESLYKSAYAFSPQNTVGEMLCDAIQDIWEQVPLFSPLLNVHDEVVGQCNPWDIDVVLAQTKPLMERTLVINGRDLTIPSDAKLGYSWGELIEI